jgi:hypothetical protein
MVGRENDMRKQGRVMKLRLMLALLAMLFAMTLPGLAEARFGGHVGGFHGFHGGFRGFHGGFRGFGIGVFPGYYPGYYYDPCWRWVRWPYWHRVWVCY